MTCVLARQRLAAYIQDQLQLAQAAAMRRHLLSCGFCHEEYEYQARLSSPLRDLAPVWPPEALSTAIRLKVFVQPRIRLWDRWQVRLSNLMGPVALPAAGGLLTAMILFAALIPAVFVTRSAPYNAEDVPTMLSTGPRFKNASPFPVTEDILVEAWNDERGKVTSFVLLNPPPGANAIMNQESSNLLLTTVFDPATVFGQPTAGKVLLSLRRINIRG